MSRNIELKCRYPDLQQAARIARTLGAECAGIERQCDTYFPVPSGRLKVRERTLTATGSADGAAPVVIEANELIQYHRPDDSGARASDYVRIDLEDAAGMIGALTSALGAPTIVRKKRTVYLHDGVRIHLDEVDELGQFLEFEAIIGPRCDDASAATKLERLRAAFSIDDADLIGGSYRELS